MISSIVRPLDVFSKAAARSSCVWLGSCFTPNTSERPCWQWIWNGAERRITNDRGAAEMEHRVRLGELHSPTVICGDIGSIAEPIKQLYTDKRCQLLPDPDGRRSDLITALNSLRKANEAPSTLVLGGLSGRMDRTLATLHSLVLAQSIASHTSLPSPIFVLDGDDMMCVLRQGSHHIQLDNTHLTGVCGIAPICQTETLVTTRGFRWDLQCAPLSFSGDLSTSNELDSELIVVDTSAPIILTFQLLASLTSLTEPYFTTLPFGHIPDYPRE
ncbi:hypothetical protein PENTCL1PPCAC_16069, partial [Pristionchus entomophagus]